MIMKKWIMNDVSGTAYNSKSIQKYKKNIELVVTNTKDKISLLRKTIKSTGKITIMVI